MAQKIKEITLIPGARILIILAKICIKCRCKVLINFVRYNSASKKD
jgi:hypothetical protein